MMHLVPLEAVDNVWPKVHDWIDNAIFKAKSNRSVIETYQQCRSGSLFMAVNTPAKEGPLSVDDIRGVLLMAIYDLEGQRTCQYVYVAGEGDTEEWFGEALKWDWFTTMGVVQFINEGRTGWVKRLETLIPDLQVIRVVFSWRHRGGSD